MAEYQWLLFLMRELWCCVIRNKKGTGRLKSGGVTFVAFFSIKKYAFTLFPNSYHKAAGVITVQDFFKLPCSYCCKDSCIYSCEGTIGGNVPASRQNFTHTSFPTYFLYTDECMYIDHGVSSNHCVLVLSGN